jgi:hypothetical protein
MRNFCILVLAVILAGCSPQKRLARLLERYPIRPTVDTFYKVGPTIYRDTVVFRYVPGETVTQSIYIDVPVDIPDTFMEVESSMATALAWLQSNELGLELHQKDSVFEFKLDSALQVNKDTVEVIRDMPYPVIEKAKPFYKIGFYILGGIVVLMLFFLFLFRGK